MGRDGTARRLREILNVLRRYEVVRGVTPEKLRLILEALGPTFIKIGQIMSMRQDLLPPAYLKELERLRMDVSPMPFETVAEVLASEYGVPAAALFERVEREPLGSASIAQAHEACLRDGRRVVIKVQRPGIRETLARDMNLLRRAADLLRLAGAPGELFDFRAVLAEMWTVAQEEMDFLIEAGHLRDFAELNKEIAYVACPRVECKLTTSRVLVMEYVDGVRVDETGALTELGYDMEDIGRKLAASYVKQVLEDGFFHADPHPGNLWIREGRIVWLDLGMMGRLSGRDRKLVRNAAIAVINRDIDALEHFVLAVGSHGGAVNHSRLYGDIDELLIRYGDMDLGGMNIGEIIGEFIAVARNNGISMPSSFTMLGRGIMTLEGVLSKCCPGISFVDVLAGQMVGSELEDLDAGKELVRMGRSLLQSGRKSLEIPGQFSDLLKRTCGGRSS